MAAGAATSWPSKTMPSRASSSIQAGSEFQCSEVERISWQLRTVCRRWSRRGWCNWQAMRRLHMPRHTRSPSSGRPSPWTTVPTRGALEDSSCCCWSSSWCMPRHTRSPSNGRASPWTTVSTRGALENSSCCCWCSSWCMPRHTRSPSNGRASPWTTVSTRGALENSSCCCWSSCWSVPRHTRSPSSGRPSPWTTMFRYYPTRKFV